MAELKLEPQWLLKVTSKELTLIRAALGGRLTDDQFRDAEELDNDLARRVVAETKQRLDQTSKLEKNLKK